MRIIRTVPLTLLCLFAIGCSSDAGSSRETREQGAIEEGQVTNEIAQPSSVANGPCAGKSCGEVCKSAYGSPLPTFCDEQGRCRPFVEPPQCKARSLARLYDCDLSHVLCDAFELECPAGQTPSVSRICYGPCVPIEQCE